MISLKNLFKHFMVVNKHRFLVFKYCCISGIPFQGIIHDLSKYSPTEFFESAKYFAGDYSPIINCKKDIGYSKCWLHHKGRNKHHLEYWVDKNRLVEVPYKYVIEMICDMISAGKVYNKNSWTIESPLKYWSENKKTLKINPNTEKTLDEIFYNYSIMGNKALNKQLTRRIYDKNASNYKCIFENDILLTLNDIKEKIDSPIYVVSKDKEAWGIVKDSYVRVIDGPNGDKTIDYDLDTLNKEWIAYKDRPINIKRTLIN